MQRREDFINEWFDRRLTMTALCERYGISRKTGYKWLSRIRENGTGELGDLSSRPHSNPRSWGQDSVDWFLALRRERPTLGPKKLRALAANEFPASQLPAVSTIGRWLDAHGLVQPRKRRRRTEPGRRPFHDCTKPNSVWCADFKGHFPVRSRRCYPVTISDANSRYLLACDALTKTTLDATKKVFERVFEEFGLPEAIRTDNGEPFASTALAGISRLSAWWISLGIRPERIDPGKPQQNGRHERMHRTLKLETASPPQSSFGRQQSAFDRFRHWYNEERPHEALGQTPPGLHYQPSERVYDEDYQSPEYGGDHEQRRVQSSGIIRWRGERVFVTTCLADQFISLRPDPTERLWTAYYYDFCLGELDERRKPWRVRAKKTAKRNNEV